MAEPRTTPSTQIQPPPPPGPPPRRSELQPSTLLVAAAASAVAAFVTSQVWPSGALWSSAAFPVIVALVKEALNRPAERVRAVRVDRFGRQQSITMPQDVADQMQEGAPPPVHGPVTIHGRRRRWWPKRWRLAVVTGLLAFAVVAIAYTVPELVAGKSLNGRDRTTLWGGAPARSHKASGSSPKAAPTATPAPGSRATPTPTATPSATPSATPTATPSAAPSATPSATPSAAPTP